MKNLHLPAATTLLFASIMLFSTKGQAQELELELRYQEPVAADSSRFHQQTREEHWQPKQTAVIVCDMWDAHHCLNAVRRVNELAPRMDQFLRVLRERGVTIIHAPSSCMAAYDQQPARQRAQSITRSSKFPEQIAEWCYAIPAEEAALYPLDQSDGGEDDDLVEHQLWAASLEARGRNPGTPWIKQCDAIHIDANRDFISDSGEEIWSILEQQQLDNVILVGVHTNMCVLGRPFGLRRLSTAGKRVVLARDLTDTMYNPAAWPFASHFTGTDLIVDHIERHVCPTISSGQILGRNFRFSSDARTRLVMLIGEDEYDTEETLPKFANRHLSQHFSVSTVFASDTNPNHFVGLERLQEADALLISVRRRPLPAADLQVVQEFLASGKPVIGIRTASHAFCLRDKQPPEGLSDWPEFDAQAFGGSYTNHFGNELKAVLSHVPTSATHSIMQAVGNSPIVTAGSLYQVAPLAPGTNVLLMGSVSGQAAEPVAWTFVRSDGGPSFYTSLGHRDDFAQSGFIALLAAGIHWACGQPVPSAAEVIAQEQRFEQAQKP